MFLLLAVQVLYGLYTTSVVTAATYDAARLAAGSDGDPGDQAAAEARVRELLGEYFTAGQVVVELDPAPSDEVVLTVTARRLGFLPAGLRKQLGLDVMRRTARVRVERAVAP